MKTRSASKLETPSGPLPPRHPGTAKSSTAKSSVAKSTAKSSAAKSSSAKSTGGSKRKSPNLNPSTGSSHKKQKGYAGGNNRKTPTLLGCQMIRTELQKANPRTRIILDGGKYIAIYDYCAPIDLTGLHGMLEIPIESSVTFKGRVTLPSDHPKHKEVLERFVSTRVPDQSWCDQFPLMHIEREVRSQVFEKVDIDGSKFRALDVKEIIQSVCDKATTATNTVGVTKQQEEDNNNNDTMKTAITTALASVSVLAGSLKETKETLASSLAATNKTVSSLADELKDTNKTVEQTNDLLAATNKTVSSLAGELKDTVEQTNDLLAATNKTVSSLAGELKDTNKTVATHGVHLQEHQRDIDSLKEKVTTVEKRWDDFRDGELKRQLEQRRYAVSPRQISFASPASAVGSPLLTVDETTPTVDDTAPTARPACIGLDDITENLPNFLLKQFIKLAEDGHYLESLSPKHKNIFEMWKKDNMKGRCNVRDFKDDFAKADFLSIKNTSDLVTLPSISDFLQDLGDDAIVVIEPGHSIAATPQKQTEAAGEGKSNASMDQLPVFIMGGCPDALISSQMLPAAWGSTVEFIVTINEDEFIISAPDSEAATDTLVAMLSLACKSQAQKIAVDVEQGCSVLNTTESCAFPFPAKPLELTRKIDTLDLLKTELRDVSAVANLLNCFKAIKLRESKVSSDVADALFGGIVFGDYLLDRLEFHGKVFVPADSLLSFIKNLETHKHDDKPFVISFVEGMLFCPTGALTVFQPTEYRMLSAVIRVGALKELPEVILQEYGYQIRRAIENGRKLRLDVDVKEIQGAFQKCCKKAVVDALHSLGSDHATTRKMQQEGTLPFDISSRSRSGLDQIRSKVKAWATGAFVPEKDSTSS